MGRVEAFSVTGCECWFYSGDHGPHHFHAGVADEWEVRILFMHDPVKYQIKVHGHEDSVAPAPSRP
jgi:hypothetical protein